MFCTLTINLLCQNCFLDNYIRKLKLSFHCEILSFIQKVLLATPCVRDQEVSTKPPSAKDEDGEHQAFWDILRILRDWYSFPVENITTPQEHCCSPLRGGGGTPSGWGGDSILPDWGTPIPGQDGGNSIPGQDRGGWVPHPRFGCGYPGIPPPPIQVRSQIRTGGTPNRNSKTCTCYAASGSLLRSRRRIFLLQYTYV